MDLTAQYWLAVGLCAALGVATVVWARRGSAPAAALAGRAIAVVLGLDAVVFVGQRILEGNFSERSSLPLNLCDLALVLAAVTCWRPRWQTGVELTYFWGLAGTLQAVVTPDLGAGFPHLAFLEFVVAHVGIVVAAAYLVVGLGLAPRRGAVARVMVVTIAYAVLVGIVDALTGSNYMYLAHRPEHASLLSLLGPWPWYIASAAAVAVVLFLLLDLPFRRSRRLAARHPGGRA